MFFASLLALAIALPSITVANENLFEGLGNHHRVVTTSSKEAQRYFDQGLNFLSGFNHDEAIRSFTQATKLDPKCTMAWWGLANANGPHINNPVVDESHAKAAFAAVQRGLAKTNRANPTERALMLATAKRFARAAMPDRSSLDKAYADAMRVVWRAHPKDADIGAFFAEALMDLRPWDLWQHDYTPQPGTQEILDTLKAVLAVDKMHPLANHLYIHAVEAGPHPEDGLPSADRLRDLQPGLGHMVHMPSHIDVRTGGWQKAIDANEKAIRSDEAYRAIRPAQGFYRVYMAHNRHMLSYASMMSGQSKLAIESIDAMISAMPTEWLKAMAPVADGFLIMPIEVRQRFGKWDEVLEQPDLAPEFPLSRTLRHAARAIAFSATGKIDEARAEQIQFGEMKKGVAKDAVFLNNPAASILVVAEHLMKGEIFIGEKKMDAAIVELREAVKAEDSLRYDEPPDWIQPTRHSLGAALLATRKYKEAAEVYRADLVKAPENGWALYGLAEALDSLGDKAQAQQVRERFNQVWKNADMKITSSCLCLREK